MHERESEDARFGARSESLAGNLPDASDTTSIAARSPLCGHTVWGTTNQGNASRGDITVEKMATQPYC